MVMGAVGLAGAGIGGVAKAGILVTAAARVAALGGVTRSLTGLIGKVGMANLAFVGLSKTFSFVQTRSGAVVAGLTATGAALQTAQWLDYNQAMRNARFQFAALAIDAQDANERLDAFRQILGRTATKELVESSEAIRLLAKETDSDLTFALLNFTNLAREKLGNEIPLVILPALLQAYRGNFDPINMLLGTNIKNTEDLRQLMERLATSLKGETVPSLTRMGQAMERINNVVGPVVGKFTDLMATLSTTALEAIADGLEAIARNIKDITATLLLGLAGAGIGLLAGGPVGALAGGLIGLGLGGLLGNLTTEGARPAALTAGGERWLPVNVTVDGAVLRRYIVNTVTREVRLVEGEP